MIDAKVDTTMERNLPMQTLSRSVRAGFAAIIAGAGPQRRECVRRTDGDNPPIEPVTQEGLVNLNLSGVAAQLPIALAADVCYAEVAVLVEPGRWLQHPCNASLNFRRGGCHVR